MAKFDQADPRWIVKERQDGTNVNGWHWTEQDCLPAIKAGFKDLAGPVIEENGMKLSVEGIDTCSGEAYVNSRKGKKFLIYDIELNLKWQVAFESEGKEVTAKGKYNFPAIDTVDGLDDMEINVKYDSEKASVQEANRFAYSKKSLVHKAVGNVVKALEKQATGSAPKPSASTSMSDSSVGAEQKSADTPAAPVPQEPAAAQEKQRVAKTSSSGLSLSASSDFNARVEDLFACFTDPQRMSAYTQSQADVCAVVGKPFSIMHGCITGENVSVTQNEKLVQKWRLKDWEDGVYSTVTIMFMQVDSGTVRVSITQSGLPEADRHGNKGVVDSTRDGWQRNFFDRIKAVFGYGAPSMAMF